MRRVLDFLVFGLLIFLLIVSQVSLFNSVYLMNSPSLLFILAFALARSKDLRSCLLVSFAGGIIYDILVLRPVGTTSFLILSITLIFSFIRRYFSHSVIFYFSFFYLSSIFYHALFLNFLVRRELPLLSFVELLILLVVLGIIRLLVSVFNPPSSIQLRFREMV